MRRIEGVQPRKVVVHRLRRHVKCVQQQVIREAIAEALRPIGIPHFDGRTPEIELARSRLDPEPSARARPGRLIRRLAIAAHEETQRLARRSAGRRLEQSARCVSNGNTVERRANLLLRQRRQAREIVQRRHRRVDATRAESFGVKGAMRLGVKKQSSQLVRLQRPQFVRGVPLRAFQRLQVTQRRPAQNRLMERPQEMSNDCRMHQAANCSCRD